MFWGSTVYLGLSSLGEKKNSMLRGALLGTTAGLGAVLLNGNDKDSDFSEGNHMNGVNKNELFSKAIEVGLYTLGGLVAGKVIQGPKKKKKK